MTKNIYVSDIIIALESRKEKTIKVYKNKINESEEEFIKEMAGIYHKKIIFASIKEIIFNKLKNVYIVQ